MPFTETFDGPGRYTAMIQTTSGPSLMFQVHNFDADPFDEADMDEAMQKLIDLVASSPDFSIVSAGKDRKVVYSLTPTP